MERSVEMRRQRRQTGATLVEFSLVGFIAVILTVAVFEFSRLSYIKNTYTVALTTAGRGISVLSTRSFSSSATSVFPDFSTMTPSSPAYRKFREQRRLFAEEVFSKHLAKMGLTGAQPFTFEVFDVLQGGIVQSQKLPIGIILPGQTYRIIDGDDNEIDKGCHKLVVPGPHQTVEDGKGGTLSRSSSFGCGGPSNRVRETTIADTPTLLTQGFPIELHALLRAKTAIGRINLRVRIQAYSSNENETGGGTCQNNCTPPEPPKDPPPCGNNYSLANGLYNPICQSGRTRVTSHPQVISPQALVCAAAVPSQVNQGYDCRPNQAGFRPASECCSVATEPLGCGSILQYNPATGAYTNRCPTGEVFSANGDCVRPLQPGNVYSCVPQQQVRSALAAQFAAIRSPDYGTKVRGLQPTGRCCEQIPQAVCGRDPEPIWSNPLSSNPTHSYNCLSGFSAVPGQPPLGKCEATALPANTQFDTSCANNVVRGFCCGYTCNPGFEPYPAGNASLCRPPRPSNLRCMEPVYTFNASGGYWQYQCLPGFETVGGVASPFGQPCGKRQPGRVFHGSLGGIFQDSCLYSICHNHPAIGGPYYPYTAFDDNSCSLYCTQRYGPGGPTVPAGIWNDPCRNRCADGYEDFRGIGVCEHPSTICSIYGSQLIRIVQINYHPTTGHVNTNSLGMFHHVYPGGSGQFGSLQALQAHSNCLAHIAHVCAAAHGGNGLTAVRAGGGQNADQCVNDYTQAWAHAYYTNRYDANVGLGTIVNVAVGVGYMFNNCTPAPAWLANVLNRLQCPHSIREYHIINYTSPVSLLWDNTINIDAVESSTRFPLNPKDKGKWFQWRASGRTPLVVWDPKGTGKIKDAEALFGNHTWGKEWTDGYKALASIDKDGNGWLENDELEGIALWFDFDQDGESDPGEVKTLKSVGVTAIGTRSDRTDAATKNIFASQGYKRVVKGKETVGESVDWFGGSVDAKLGAEARKDREAKVPPEYRDEPGVLPASMRTSDAPRQLYTPLPFDPKSNFSGVWEWRMIDDEAMPEMLPGGLLAIHQEGNAVSGQSVVSNQLAPNIYGVERTLERYRLAGTVALNVPHDPHEMRFELTDKDGRRTKSWGWLSDDGMLMLGFSEVEAAPENDASTAVVHGYRWFAKRSVVKE